MDSLREGMLIGLGNPLLDISAVVGKDLLEKYGLKPNDAILAEDKHKPLYDELQEKYQVEYIAGGSCQNSLRVAQWILRKPNVCIFAGCVGRDKYSDILEKKAREDGVNVLYQYTTERPTGTCAVLITGANRSLCANLSAAECLTPQHLQSPVLNKALQSAEFYYSSSFLLTVSVQTILEVAQIALKRNKIFAMNLSAPFLCQFFKKEMMMAYPYVDIIFGNESEALAFAKEQNLGTINMKEIALKMTKLAKQNNDRPRVAVITQGKDPVLLAQNDTVTEYPVQELSPDKIVDTNGAGDAFVGGFLAQLVLGEPFSVCIDCGIWAASQIIQNSGCTFKGVSTYSKKV